MSITITSYHGILDGAYGLILTANSLEKAAVAAVLGDSVKADIGATHQGAALSFEAAHILLHVTGGVGGSVETSTGHLARHFLHTPRPRPAFVILIGICWGNPNKVAAGEVIVATQVASLNHQREDRDGRIYRRTDIESAVAVPDWLCTQIATAKGYATHRGVIGSAELHLSADMARDNLLAQHADLLGGEMEAFAFLPDLRDIPWIVVKGVSDNAGDATDKAAQAIAAGRAAGVLPELIHALTMIGALPTPVASPARDALVDAIIGDTIAVSRPDDVASINDHLNNDCGTASDADPRGKNEVRRCRTLTSERVSAARGTALTAAAAPTQVALAAER